MSMSTRRSFLAKAGAGSLGAGLLVAGGSLGLDLTTAAAHGQVRPEIASRREYLGTVQLIAPGSTAIHYHAYELFDAHDRLQAYEYVLDGGAPDVPHLQTRQPLHVGMAGLTGAHVGAFTPADARYLRRISGDRVVTHGVPFSELRTLFRGSRGVLVDPVLGRRHAISLVPFEALPDETHLHIAFTFQPMQPRSAHPLRSFGQASRAAAGR